MRSVTSNQNYREYYQGSENVIGGPKGMSFFGSAFVMMLMAFIATLYISSYLLPLMVVLRSFYIPLVIGVGVPASVIGALMLILGGSVWLAALTLIAAFAAVVFLAGISGIRA